MGLKLKFIWACMRLEARLLKINTILSKNWQKIGKNWQKFDKIILLFIRAFSIGTVVIETPKIQYFKNGLLVNYKTEYLTSTVLQFRGRESDCDLEKTRRFWTGFITAAYHQYLVLTIPADHPHLF